MQFAKAMNIHSEWYAGLFLDISMLIWIENNLFTTVHGFYLYNHTKHQPKIDVFEYFRCVFSFVCFNTNRQNAPFHMKNQRKCTTVCCSSSCHLKVKRQFHLKSATELKCNYVVERRKTNARKQQWCRIKKCWLHSTVKFHILKEKKNPEHSSTCAMRRSLRCHFSQKFWHFNGSSQWLLNLWLQLVYIAYAKNF